MTNYLVTNVGFTNKAIAQTLNKGFGSRTNLAKVLGKSIGTAKFIGDSLVLAAAYFYSCSALGQ